MRELDYENEVKRVYKMLVQMGVYLPTIFFGSTEAINILVDEFINVGESVVGSDEEICAAFSKYVNVQIELYKVRGRSWLPIRPVF